MCSDYICDKLRQFTLYNTVVVVSIQSLSILKNILKIDRVLVFAVRLVGTDFHVACLPLRHESYTDSSLRSQIQNTEGPSDGSVSVHGLLIVLD